MKKVKTKTIYKCDRCGKEFEDIYCHMDVHLPYDLSICGAEYHFCEECYKKIHDVMTDKDQKGYTKEIVYYPVYLPNREWQWGPNYPITYTTTAKWTDGITINAKDINPNVITTETINNNNEINCIDNNVAKVCIQGNYY